VSDVAAFELMVTTPPVPPDESYRPFVFELGDGERARLDAFSLERGIRVIDRMAFQRDGGEGPWVYLPWDRKVVHLLGPEAYFEAITERNADKITREEQRLLRQKRVAVVGLSVGAEAAATIAREHLCGELVIADFDRLELSNLNRIEAGFDELGENKAIIAARRIAKANPYLPVTVYPDGVTRENLESFMSGIDLLVDECDGMAMKLELRRYCRQRRVNVVFAADERGFLSVEPYGYFPDLPPFHGRITATQPRREDFETPMDFMKELTRWMGGWDAISARSRRSLEQLGKTLTGYPQLASEARFAAGQVGHVVRRLLLGERVRPYFGYLDLEEIVPND
jgi:tRNA threonylcarbamoyladenosine dehydratase